MNLKRITKKDQLNLKKLYFDSIISIDESIYTKEQKRAWASQAWENKNFDLSINSGKGWLIIKNEKIIINPICSSPIEGQDKDQLKFKTVFLAIALNIC